jgi:hypothetical protein
VVLRLSSRDVFELARPAHWSGEPIQTFCVTLGR